MRNFFSKIQDIKPSRRWQVLNTTFQADANPIANHNTGADTKPSTHTKTLSVLLVFLAVLLVSTTQVYGHGYRYTTTIAQQNDTDVFFRRETEVNVPIIMYHLVTEKSKYIGKYGIPPSELEKDLKYLKDNGYNTVVMKDLIDFVKDGKSLPKKPVVLTFDDGNASDFNHLLPLLEKYHMKAVTSIIGKVTDEMTRDTEKYPNSTFPNLCWEQVKKLHEHGALEVQNHGYNVHGPAGSGKLRNESADAYHQRLLADIKTLQDLCQKHLNYMPNTFCYPLGIVSKGSQAVLEELGFKASLSCHEGMNVLKHGEEEGLFLLKRVNRANGRSAESIIKALEADSKSE